MPKKARSHEFFQRFPRTRQRLHAGSHSCLPVLEVFWSDWGSPQRLEQPLELLERAGGTTAATARRQPAQADDRFWQAELRYLNIPGHR